MLSAARRAPGRFTGFASRLFQAMADRGGEVDFTPVQWFNGGLFDDDTALPLDADDIALLERTAALDWADIDPSILGTLFERGLDPDKRSQLGAHYTDREKIEKLIDPVVRRPLLAEWAKAKKRIEDAMPAKPASKAARGAPAPAGRGRPPRRRARLRAFLDRLRAFRVLDPACGSGNFLYLSLLALKDIEHQAMVEAEALGLQREFPQVGPEAVLGIEINPFAAELARVSVWIGHIQWARRHGLPAAVRPGAAPARHDRMPRRRAGAGWHAGSMAESGCHRRQPAVSRRKAYARGAGGRLLRPTVRRLRRAGPGGGRPGLLLVRAGAGGDCRRPTSSASAWSRRTASEAARTARAGRDRPRRGDLRGVVGRALDGGRGGGARVAGLLRARGPASHRSWTAWLFRRSMRT